MESQKGKAAIEIKLNINQTILIGLRVDGKQRSMKNLFKVRII